MINKKLQLEAIVDILQTVRDQLPIRWGKELSQGTILQAGVELGFIRYRAGDRTYSPTKRGLEFGCRRLMPKEG